VNPDIESLQDDLAAQGVKYFFGAYTDVHGVPKSKAVPLSHLADAAAGSELYTVGALEGMGELGPNEDECVSIPDLSRTTVLPWDTRYAMAPSNLFLHDRPYPFDFRAILQRQTAAAAELGFTANLGVEPELYVLRPTADGGWEPFVPEDTLNAPTRGYDLETTMLADAFLEPMTEYIDQLGWGLYSFDHEGGDGQYEFDFGYTEIVDSCDRMVLFRLMSKHVARTLGCIASYMPKPMQSSFGSGAHFNLSLASVTDGTNLFDAAVAPEGRSAGDSTGYTELAHQFTAGVLEHAAAITAVLAPTVNSYKRLLPRGLMREISWAPVYAAHGSNNRTLMCRLPVNRRCLEVRIADSAVNFHLAAALTLGAGLDGIRRGLKPGDPVNIDTYSLSERELAERGVHRLPRDLGEAVAAFRADAMVRDVLGDEVTDHYADLKDAEWLEYNTVVSQWERDRYLQLW
jgi:glutamine synthetase